MKYRQRRPRQQLQVEGRGFIASTRKLRLQVKPDLGPKLRPQGVHTGPAPAIRAHGRRQRRQERKGLLHDIREHGVVRGFFVVSIGPRPGLHVVGRKYHKDPNKADVAAHAIGRQCLRRERRREAL